MKTKLIKLALSFFSSDDGRKFVRNVAVIIVSPFVAITVLIGAIFSDGISFNHNLVTDLFEGNPISELTGEMKQYVQEIQDGLVLIDSHIDKINQTFTNGSSLNIYQVKGYFIGYMVSSQHKVFSDEMAEVWVNSFTEGEEVKVPTSVNAVIYASLEKNLNEKLLKDTRKSMETCYGALIGNDGKTVTTLSKEQMDQAIAAFKQQQAANTPDVVGMQNQITETQNQLTAAQAAVQQAQVESAATMMAVTLGIDAKTIPYVLKMADLSQVIGQDGKINDETLKNAVNKVLEDIPALKPQADGKTGFTQIGTGGNPAQHSPQTGNPAAVPTKRWNRFNN